MCMKNILSAECYQPFSGKEPPYPILWGMTETLDKNVLLKNSAKPVELELEASLSPS